MNSVIKLQVSAYIRAELAVEARLRVRPKSTYTTFLGINHYIYHPKFSRIPTSACPLWLTLGARLCPMRLCPYRAARESFPRPSNDNNRTRSAFPSDCVGHKYACSLFSECTTACYYSIVSINYISYQTKTVLASLI